MNKLEWTYTNKGTPTLTAHDGHHEYKIENTVSRKHRIKREEHILRVDGNIRSSVCNQGAGRLIELANEISKTAEEMREVAS